MKIKKLKLLIYYFLKTIGIFKLFELINRDKVRILCYHGISIHKEHEYFENLFITEDLFVKKILWLKRNGYSFINLDQLYDDCSEKTRNPVIVTFDDGWSGIYATGIKFLYQENIPWTLYLSTYYVINPYYVFNILIQYIVNQSNKSVVEIELPKNNEYARIVLEGKENRTNIINYIIANTERFIDKELRDDYLKYLAIQFDVDISWILEHQCFKYLSPSQVYDLSRHGCSVELHTHRHVFPPDDLVKARQEIEENKEHIEKITGRIPKHFCYPSGIYDKNQFDLLSKLEIKTATTVNLGLCSTRSNKYELKRILDSQNLSFIEFQAEVCGFASFLRRLFFKVKN
jgi:peptidoglycan/xylan/chitin deacetylase (PgdA/CDA1 family)